MDIPGAWENEKGRTILWAIPEQPEGFVNISALAKVPGLYVLGQSFFHTANFPITSIFKRNVTGGAEEFLLGAISVLIIAVLSEVVQAVLMRTRRRTDGKASRRGVQIAFLVDEFYHVRNLFSHVIGTRGGRSHGQDDSARMGTFMSFTVLCIALALMAADVFAVYLTQASTFYSSDENQYNLRGFQPIGTDRGTTKWINRLARDISCVSPAFTDGGQKREFTINACIMFDIKEAHMQVTDTIDEIKVRSFFHKAGSEHRVTFGDAVIGIRKRTFLYATDNEDRKAFTKRITFETNDTNDFAYTKYIHELFIYSVLEVNCNDGPVTCKERVKQLEASPGEHSIVEQEITFWRTRENDDKALVRGIESTYRIPLDNPFTSIDKGINPLVATAAIEEVGGPGTYVDITHEDVETDLRGLISEEGRVAGLVALLSIFGFFSVLLVVLRVVLRPLSLSELAWDACNRESEASSESSRGKVVNSRSRGSSLELEVVSENDEFAAAERTREMEARRKRHVGHGELPDDQV